MDSRLTPEELEQVGVLLTMAFKEVRLLGWDGKAEQASDLSDAVAALPTQMFTLEPDLAAFEEALRDYQARYPARGGDGLTFDYAAFLARLRTRGMTTARVTMPAGTTPL